MISIRLKSLIAIGASCLILWPGPAICSQTGEDFPLNPGSWWKYQDQDGNTDTVSITGTVIISGVPFVEVMRNGINPGYFLRTRAGLYRFNALPRDGQAKPTGAPLPTMVIKFPLAVGQTWSSPWTDPPLSFSVIDEDTFETPAGKFPHTFKIAYRPVSDPIYHGYSWYAPGVGFVGMEENRYRSKLISYSISDLLPPAPVGKKIADLLPRLGIIANPEKNPGTAKTKNINNGYSSAARFLIPGILLLIFIAVLTWLIRLNRKMDMDSDPMVLRGELALASAMVREGLYADAADILQRQAVKNPQWPDVAALLGQAYTQMGRYEDACLELKRALTLNPHLASARLDLAQVYLANDEPSRALEELDAVLAKNPGFADVLVKRSRAYLALGNTEHAEADAREALDINSSFTDARELLEEILSS